MSHEIGGAETLGRDGPKTDSGVLSRGTQLGRYTILDLVGAGGMGTVCSAYDPNLDRKVAIKVLRGDWGEASEILSARLLREAQALAKLSHPNVVTVFEAGTLGSQVFIAMEFIDGLMLSDYIKQTLPSWEEIAELFLKAGEGLAAAHDARMIHRDFKPDNVIIGKDDRVLVTDFGLARYDGDDTASVHEITAARLRDPARSLVTEEGALMGTPGYMSPEQLLGKACDARSDQFSFGVSLWEALYGELPFDGDTIGAMKVAIDANTVRPPTHSRVPRSLRKAILRSIRAAPAERFESMHVFLSHIRRSLGWRRRKWLVIPALAVVAGATAFALTRSEDPQAGPCTGGKAQIAQTWNDARRAELEAVFGDSKRVLSASSWPTVESLLNNYAQEWAAMHRDACVATRVSGEQSETILDRRMLCLDRRRVQLSAFIDLLRAGTSPALREATKSAYELPQIRDCANIESLTSAIELPTDPATRAQVENVRMVLARSSALAGAGLYENALADSRGAVEQATLSRNKPAEAEALLSVGSLQWRSGNPKGSEEELLRAVEVAEVSHHVAVKTMAKIELVKVVGYELERVPEGLMWGRLAAASLEASGNDPLLRARLLNNLSNVNFRKGDNRLSLDLVQQALEIRQQLLGENHPDIAASHDNVSTCFLRLGEYEKAQFHSKKALELRLRLLGESHPLVAESHNNLGNILFEQRQNEEARKEFQTGLDVWRASLGEEHPNIAIALTNLAVIDDEEGRANEALAKYQRAFEIEEKALGPTHPQVAASLEALALRLNEYGKSAPAAEALERAIQIRQAAFGGENKLTITARLHLASVQLSLGEPVKARDLLERAFAQQELDKVDPRVSGQAMFQLAQLLWREAPARVRALELARRGRENVFKAGDPTDEIDQWLAANTAPR